MATNIWNVITTYYINSPVWLVLSALAIIYIVYISELTVRKRIFGCAVFAFLTILNELSYHFLIKIFDAASYYRFLWVIPYVMLVSYALMKCLQRLWREKERGIALLLVLSLGLVLFMSQGDYVRRMRDNIPQNKYLVTNDMIQLRDILQREKNTGRTIDEPVIACPQMVMLQYQTLDAKCQILTDRNLYLVVRGYGEDINKQDQRTQDAYLLSQVCEDGTMVDVDQVQDAVDRQKVNYMIVNKNANLASYMEEMGFTLVDVTDSYELYSYEGELSCDRTVDETQVETIKERFGISEDRIDINLGLQKQYEILTVNDMHIITEDDSVQPEYQNTVKQRQNELFINDTGIHSKNMWNGISAILDSYQAEGIVFIGDMVDYNCNSNLDILQQGLNKIQTPHIYLRADHDLGVWYTDGKKTEEQAREASTVVAEWKDMYVIDYGEFYLLGWNNSTSQLSEQGLEVAQDALSQAKLEGKPVILATHVPINSQIDDGLKAASESFDPQGRAKLWGEGCLYVPNATTAEFMELILAEDSPVKAVLAGHLHFKYTIKLNENITEYVLDKAFSGNIGVIKVK